MQTPANSGTGPEGSVGAEAGQVRALSEGPSNKQLTVSVDRTTAGVVVLHVAGEIDLLTANVLGERLREQLQRDDRAVVLDLTAVSFLGSAGLAEIVSASQAGEDRGVKLLLVATNRAVLRPLEVTGLASLITVFDTVEAALGDVDE